MESAKSGEMSNASVTRGARMDNDLTVCGYYNVECRDSEGNLLWKDTAENLVTTVGKNLLLDGVIRNQAVSAAGYIGLISAVSWSTAAIGDTMSSHAGWNEASAVASYYPTITRREAATFGSSAVGGAVTSSAATFAITGTTTGTVMGCFLVTGTSASSALASTWGTLYSAGTFSGGSKTVGNGDSISVTYVTTLS